MFVRHVGDSSDITLAFEDAQVILREETDNTDDTDDTDDTADVESRESTEIIKSN